MVTDGSTGEGTSLYLGPPLTRAPVTPWALGGTAGEQRQVRTLDWDARALPPSGASSRPPGDKGEPALPPGEAWDQA